jgi:hypothetical protein
VTKSYGCTYSDLDAPGERARRGGHGQASVLPDRPLQQGRRIFNEPRLCAAIADRITFRCTLIETGTDSYRFQATEDERGTKNAP